MYWEEDTLTRVEVGMKCCMVSVRLLYNFGHI